MFNRKQEYVVTLEIFNKLNLVLGEFNSRISLLDEEFKTMRDKLSVAELNINSLIKGLKLSPPKYVDNKILMVWASFLLCITLVLIYY